MECGLRDWSQPCCRIASTIWLLRWKWDYVAPSYLLDQLWKTEADQATSCCRSEQDKPEEVIEGPTADGAGTDPMEEVQGMLSQTLLTTDGVYLESPQQ
jgi:hypothetical protein